MLAWPRNSIREPVDEGHLPKAEGGECQPGGDFAEPERGLAGGTEPETNLDRSCFNQIAIAKDSGLNPFTIEKRGSLAGGLHNKAFARNKR